MNGFVCTVPGIPRPQGSLKIVTSRSTGRPIAKNSGTTVAHRNLVVGTLAQAWEGSPIDDPVSVKLEFHLPRPRSHFGTGRNVGKVKLSAPQVPITTPDTDKLVRLVNDALTIAGVVRDDALIVHLEASKVYGDTPKTVIEVSW